MEKEVISIAAQYSGEFEEKLIKQLRSRKSNCGLEVLTLGDGICASITIDRDTFCQIHFCRQIVQMAELKRVTVKNGIATLDYEERLPDIFSFAKKLLRFKYEGMFWRDRPTLLIRITEFSEGESEDEPAAAAA